MMISKKEFWVIVTSLLALLIAISKSAQALTLDEYLVQVQSKHRSLRSYEASMEAATARKDQNDLDLSPVLTMSAFYTDDKRVNGTPPSILVPHQQIRDYSLGLGKKFSTGTQAQITAGATAINQDTTLLPGNTTTSDQFGLAGIGLTFQQSLWKDAFGHSTRLRLQREDVSARLERETYDLQSKQLLVDAEAAYWDLIYLQDEMEQRKSSLERAKRIETWVKNRSANGIGDKADVLNAQGLAAARELQLISTQDELTAAQKRIADILELGASEPLPEFKGDLSQSRSLNAAIGGAKNGRVLRLDSYLSVLEAKAKSIASEEVSDSMRPDLVLQGAYKTNAFKDNITGAVDRWTNTDTPTASVGLKLTWLLDGDTKNNTRKAAKMDALAAALKQERKLLESDSAWSEINRRYSELSKRIEAAAKINQIQSAKASAEREKLSKGRSITSQVILAEQDAAEAGLTLSKLKAEQRKLEAQGRLFVKVGDQ